MAPLKKDGYFLTIKLAPLEKKALEEFCSAREQTKSDVIRELVRGLSTYEGFKIDFPVVDSIPHQQQPVSTVEVGVNSIPPQQQPTASAAAQRKVCKCEPTEYW